MYVYRAQQHSYSYGGESTHHNYGAVIFADLHSVLAWRVFCLPGPSISNYSNPVFHKENPGPRSCFPRQDELLLCPTSHFAAFRAPRLCCLGRRTLVRIQIRHARADPEYRTNRIRGGFDKNNRALVARASVSLTSFTARAAVAAGSGPGCLQIHS